MAQKSVSTPSFTTNGGDAEYAIKSQNLIVALPDEVEFDAIAILTQGLTAYEGAD